MAGLPRWWKQGVVGVALALGAVAFGVGSVVWHWNQEFSPRDFPLAKALVPEPVAVAAGVYLLGKTDPAAAYLVETSQGLVLIDSGLEADAVSAQIAGLGFDVGHLKAVLLTHVHADHSLGAQALRERSGAKVHAGRGDCLPLHEGGPREAFFSTFSMPHQATHPTTVDVALEGGETLVFGETKVTAVAAPGHTPGSMCYLLERPGLRALFSGDVIQHLTPDRSGSMGTYSAYLAPLYRGNARDYLATLRRLRALPPPDLVLPGHPRMDAIPQSPRLGAERWQGLMDQGISEMEKLLARYDTDGADFLDGHAKELLPGLHYLGDHGGAAVYVLNGPKGLLLFDAPGDDLLAAFLAQRFAKLGWEGEKVSRVLLTSADERTTGGLAGVVKEHGCKVVAPAAGAADVRRRCPSGTEVIAAEDWEKDGGLDGRVIPLAGRGKAPAAYQFRWADKTVLVSGRMPTKLTEKSIEELMAEVAGPGGSVADFVKSLERLQAVHPNLWLPAVPVQGQNANLYDQDWSRVLSQNNRLFLR